MRPSSGTSIPRQPHVPGGRSNEMKLPSSARHQAPLPARPPLPVSHPPVLPEATPSPGVPTPAFRTRCLPSGPCAGSPASRRWGSRLPLLPLQPPPRPAPLLRTPLPVLWIRFQVQFCGQGRGGPALHISALHPARPQAPAPSGRPAGPSASPLLCSPRTASAPLAAPTPAAHARLSPSGYISRMRKTWDQGRHSVCRRPIKAGTGAGSRPVLLTTHHDGVIASLPEEGVSLPLVQSPGPLPGHCCPPLPPCPSSGLAVCT